MFRQHIGQRRRADDGGIENVYGSDTGAIIGDGGLQTVYGAATNVGDTDPGVQVVAVSGAATGTKLYGGEQDVYGTATGTIVNAGGLAIVYAGGTLTNAAIDGGSVELKPGARVSAGLAFQDPAGFYKSTILSARRTSTASCPASLPAT